jgi:hypothetical protein
MEDEVTLTASYVQSERFCSTVSRQCNGGKVGETHTFDGGSSKTCHVKLSQISWQNRVSQTSLGGSENSGCESEMNFSSHINDFPVVAPRIRYIVPWIWVMPFPRTHRPIGKVNTNSLQHKLGVSSIDVPLQFLQNRAVCGQELRVLFLGA